MNKRFTSVILATFLMLSLVVVLCNASQTFTVPALGKQIVTINLSQGDSVSGSVSVSGGSGNDIDFTVSDPNGNTLTSYDRTTYTGFSFSASMTGSYKITLDNSFSWLSSKSVTLDYSVNRSILGGGGGSNNLFLILAVLGVLLVAIALIAIVLKVAHSNKQNIPSPKPAVNPISTQNVSYQTPVTKATRFCQYCGAPHEEGALYCRKCGKKL